MAYTLDGNTLSTVNFEESTKNANLFTMAIPRKNSEESVVLDLFGVTRTITIKGTYVGADTSAIATYAALLDSFVSGTQSSVDYHSDTSNQTYKVQVDETKWNYVEGSPLSIEWSIVLIEGKITLSGS